MDAGPFDTGAALAVGEDNFEPQARARSNTWPLPEPSVPGGAKKNSSRRNAWGNLSYADLITQAICAAPEQRLTLSQIYEHMVQHVAYFKDKGDSNSSAGWKNSIRHNLSLHNRFMRVQNEGTGKSSWWMINPDAKPGKSARRRAVSMETSKFEKRRGRVKKKVDALRANTNVTTSPASSVSESLDLFPDSPRHFQASPDFRPRAASNASSCGGRLSPIADPEWFGATPLFQATPPYHEHAHYPSPAHAQSHQDSMGQLEMRSFGLDTSLKTPSYGHEPNIKSPYDLEPSLKAYALEVGLKSPYTHESSRKSPYAHEASMKAAQYGAELGGKSAQYGPDQLSANMAAGMRLEFGFNQSQPSLQQQQQEFDSTGPRTVMGQLMGALNHSLLDDLNLNIETMHGGFDCNVDEVIKHELSVDGSLEFNFQPPGATETQQEQQGYPGSGHWVH